MELTGTIVSIADTQIVSDKFRKREFVILDKSGKYDQTIQFEAAQDNVDLLDKVTEGQEVTVSFDIRGREWKSPKGEVKYFNTLAAWKITPVNGTEKKQDDDEFDPFK